MTTRKRHSPEQVVRKLAQADRMLGEGKDVADVCRELQVAEQTYYRWRNQFGGLKADDAKRLKDLERENSTLKRLLADAELEKAALKEIAPGKLLSPERRRAAVAHLIATMGLSERFACRVTGQNRTTQRREPVGTTVGDPDAGLRTWLRQYAKDHPRRGFRPAYHDARGEGWTVNHKKVQRLWREEGLRVPQRRRRKRLGTSTAPDRPKADAANAVWAVDFQFDATTDGRPIKIVSIVDEHTRECLGGLVERSITADVLIDELDCIATTRGYPAVLRCDNGPEFACDAMADWAGERVGLSFIPPGEPWRNGYVESFNSRVRDECLNINIFWSLAQARVVISDWKEDYNHRRRHSSLGYQAPADYAAACTH
ncbi:IS3 family transposase [Jatrophihabitans lederbergiae]|uniref:IS3 family transposase n=1 Tax=Jatrophihabitans lederbergiae TaxID=3075547 RepID=A0ABU2JF82_9ACTN|nr:IS3 family transposase [Jatrophihabitans sp. DSM 44399]MDT0263406.1 IS3 family transposase [Jatrophihabitans sp. DSM 44399]